MHSPISIVRMAVGGAYGATEWRECEGDSEIAFRTERIERGICRAFAEFAFREAERAEAKVFGGGAVISGMNSLNVGERNTKFVMDYLAMERIPVVSKDVLEIYPRKVCFLPASGKAMVKRLATTNTDAFLQQDRLAAQKAVPVTTGGGSIDLF